MVQSIPGLWLNTDDPELTEHINRQWEVKSKSTEQTMFKLGKQQYLRLGQSPISINRSNSQIYSSHMHITGPTWQILYRVQNLLDRTFYLVKQAFKFARSDLQAGLGIE